MTNVSIKFEKAWPNQTILIRQVYILEIYVKGHCDLDLYLIDSKINTEHLLSITNVCIKFEKAGPNQL